MMETKKLDPLTVAGTLDSLEAIGQYVMDAAEAAGLGRRPAYKLRLAVDEIATNTILYGYRDVPGGGDLHLSATVDDQALTLVLEDMGTPFDPMQREMPLDELDDLLEDRDPGGLGIFLAVRGVDDFRYEHEGGRNRNTFVVKRTTDEAS